MSLTLQELTARIMDTPSTSPLGNYLFTPLWSLNYPWAQIVFWALFIALFICITIPPMWRRFNATRASRVVLPIWIGLLLILSIPTSSAALYNIKLTVFFEQPNLLTIGIKRAIFNRIEKDVLADNYNIPPNVSECLISINTKAITECETSELKTCNPPPLSDRAGIIDSIRKAQLPDAADAIRNKCNIIDISKLEKQYIKSEEN